MKIEQFTIAISRTINLGNFESCRLEASITVNPEDDSYELAKPKAQVELRKLLEETYRAQGPGRNKERGSAVVPFEGTR